MHSRPARPSLRCAAPDPLFCRPSRHLHAGNAFQPAPRGSNPSPGIAVSRREFGKAMLGGIAALAGGSALSELGGGRGRENRAQERQAHGQASDMKGRESEAPHGLLENPECRAPAAAGAAENGKPRTGVPGQSPALKNGPPQDKSAVLDTSPMHGKGHVLDKCLFQIVSEAMAESGVHPRDLPFYLALLELECQFNPRTVSDAAASGIFQFRAPTAEEVASKHPSLRGRGLRMLGRPSAGSLKRMARERPFHELIAEHEVFDPRISALLATYHVDGMRRGFGAYRAYTHIDESGEARVFRTAFRPREDALMMAAACFHIGESRVFSTIAREAVRSFSEYMTAIRGSEEPIHRKNAAYLSSLWWKRLKYGRIISGSSGPWRVPELFMSVRMLV